jgi:8-oxo-dGTP pyrophosphatase MutT (NUDIX family)
VTDAMPLPPAMVERARAFQGPPAPTRAAATVVLLRPARSPFGVGQALLPPVGLRAEDETFEVYVLKRATTMVFGGAYAFPGGGVDPSDRPETLRDDWAERLGVSDEQARAVVGAAARELFEEAGVLLAGPRDEVDRTVSDGSFSGIVTVGGAEAAAAAEGRDEEAEDAAPAAVGDVSAADWEADRAAIAARELTMTELLERRGLRLRDDLLVPWARWITPEFEPRRFDTWFFVALLPESQTARDVSGEAERAHWIAPAENAKLTMLPPTRTMLNDLAAYRKIAEVVAAGSRRDAATPVMPRVIFTEDGGALLRIARAGRH